MRIATRAWSFITALALPGMVMGTFLAQTPEVRAEDRDSQDSPEAAAPWGFLGPIPVVPPWAPWGPVPPVPGPEARLGQMFGMPPGLDAFLKPPFRVHEDDDRIDIELSLPGMVITDVTTELRNGLLKVRGNGRPAGDRDRVRGGGGFEWAFDVPEGVTADAIQVKRTGSTLHIIVTKPVPARAVKIQ